MACIFDFAAGLLRTVDEAIFKPDDEFARNQGWRVEKGRFGLSRTYRHPSFDWLARCQQHSDRGRRGDADCPRSAGSGQITLGERLPVLRWKAWRGTYERSP